MASNGREPEHVKTEGFRNRQEDRKGDHDNPDPVDETSQDDVNDLHQGVSSPFAQSQSDNSYPPVPVLPREPETRQ